jgi:hypothetical protein
VCCLGEVTGRLYHHNEQHERQIGSATEFGEVVKMKPRRRGEKRDRGRGHRALGFKWGTTFKTLRDRACSGV